jgi:two-component system, OmpR family, sensor kinase
MSRVWYQSLYWRIAVSLIAFLALALIAQGVLFIWMTDRIAGSMPAQSPRRLAVLVASDVAAALQRDPELQLGAYVQEQYSRVFQPIVLLMRDGRSFTNRSTPVSPPMDAVLREEVARLVAARRFERRRNELSMLERRTGLRPRAEFAPIVVDNTVTGFVAVQLGRPPFSLLVRELGPTMGLVGGLVLAAGGTVIAFVLFGPVRRRIRQVQEATERVGAGDLAARAPEHGGDEVAELARSFNRMAEELASRAQALEASDRARRQLLADVSHELMTPLTAMRGYIETLGMRDLPLDAATRERYLGIIDEETRRLESIIGDLLDLARLEGGGTAFRREPVDVAGLFDRVASRHEREMHARGIRLVRDVHPDAAVVTGDADRLEQALQNLAANALRHTPGGGQIALTAAPGGADVRIVLRDSGPGIPAEHLPLIFDRFYKVDASRRVTGGSGLGLSIVKTIVERHGGTIAARNEHGAVFEIVLPRRSGGDRGDRSVQDATATINDATTHRA